jgi:hypothetical protein
MSRRNLGLTELYRLIHDPETSALLDRDVAHMRELYVELDEAVLDAYGWSDIAVDYGFHAYRQTERWTVGSEARTEIVNRLLEENHRRAAAETSRTKRSTKDRKSHPEDAATPSLFSSGSKA